ncbi:MAG: hypothetical protein KF884_01400 [Fimbriimonadaceae bacterium]|nr:hypothetical protein [Fimbriimonadaceae bacterium]QYK58751.1 MAG: hypothetical protein KF884_01400 [Fimbriimonadaceae bacterium]
MGASLSTYGEVMEALRSERAKHEESVRVVRGIAIGAGVLLIGLKLYGHFAKGLPLEFDSLTTVMLLLLLGGAWAPGLRRASLAAAELRDPRLAGHLLEAYYSDESQVKAAASQALDGALDRVTADHSEHFTPLQLGLLHRYLKSAKTVGTARVALRALRCVAGAETALVLREFNERNVGASDPKWQSLAAEALMASGEIQIRAARKLVLGETASRTVSHDA